ncbi:hypothetical protein NFJ02_13g14300 [Pycnococcus provasolii]
MGNASSRGGGLGLKGGSQGSSGRVYRPSTSNVSVLPAAALRTVVTDIAALSAELLNFPSQPSEESSSPSSSSAVLLSRIQNAATTIKEGLLEIEQFAETSRLMPNDTNGHLLELTAILKRVQDKIRSHEAAQVKGQKLLAKIERCTRTLELGSEYIKEGRHGMKYDDNLMKSVGLTPPDDAASHPDDVHDEPTLNQINVSVATLVCQLATTKGVKTPADKPSADALNARATQVANLLTNKLDAVAKRRAQEQNSDIDLMPHFKDLTRFITSAENTAQQADAKGYKGAKLLKELDGAVNHLEACLRRLEEVGVLMNRATRSPSLSPQLRRGKTMPSPSPRTSSASSTPGTSTEKPKKKGGLRRRPSDGNTSSGTEDDVMDPPARRRMNLGKNDVSPGSAMEVNELDDDDLEEMLRSNRPTKRTSPTSQQQQQQQQNQQQPSALNPTRATMEDSSSEEEEEDETKRRSDERRNSPTTSSIGHPPQSSDSDAAAAAGGERFGRRPMMSATDLVKQARRDLQGGPGGGGKPPKARAGMSPRGNSPRAKQQQQQPQPHPQTPPPPHQEPDVEEVAKMLELENRLDESLSWYLRAFNGGAQTACADVGRVLESLGKPEEARAWYQKGINLGAVGGARRCHNALGVSLLAQARSLESLLSPEEAEQHHSGGGNLSVADAKANIERQARFHFEQATRSATWGSSDGSGNDTEPCAAAWNNLGYLYEEGLAGFGTGTNKKEEEDEAAKQQRLATAEQMYNRAADLNHFSGCLNSAFCALSRGDATNAVGYYRRAKTLQRSGAVTQDQNAKRYLEVLDTIFDGGVGGDHLRDEEDDDERWAAALEFAGGMGDARSLYILAEKLLDPASEGMHDDEEISSLSTPARRVAHAVRLLHESARLGDANAVYRLGVLAETGMHGMMRDHHAALECYRRAALAGHPEAMSAMTRLGEECLSSLAFGG